MFQAKGAHEKSLGLDLHLWAVGALGGIESD
jgi:hypothetical protein